MATFTFSKSETTCQEESDIPNFANVIEKKISPNERAALYKKPISKDNVRLEMDFNDTPQEIRRQRILYYQKKNRDEAINARRGLVEELLDSDNEEEMEEVFEDESFEMEVDPHKRKHSRVYKYYANLLMLSEWMLEVPQDFAEKWIMVPCPVGKRCVVVACKGTTKVYSRQGKFVRQFKSFLPGGNPKRTNNVCTILDCIWDMEKKTFYILDVLAWSRQEMLECETECRFFWVRSQMDELPEIKEVRKGHNDYAFVLLPNLPCDRDFHDSLETIAASMKLDGLLFYHKEVHYTSGKTPLVAWLKPYMLPEVLGMSVPAPYDEKPSSYIDFEHHVLKVIQQEKERIEKKQQRDKRQSKSELEESKSELEESKSEVEDME